MHILHDEAILVKVWSSQPLLIIVLALAPLGCPEGALSYKVVQ